MSKYDAKYWIKCLRDPGWVGRRDINEQIAAEMERLLKENGKHRNFIGHLKNNFLGNPHLKPKVVVAWIREHFIMTVDGCEHDLVKPEDTDRIQWGDYKVCIKCRSIVKPDGTIFMAGAED